jgi:hypothetical protein
MGRTAGGSKPATPDGSELNVRKIKVFAYISLDDVISSENEASEYARGG